MDEERLLGCVLSWNLNGLVKDGIFYDLVFYVSLKAADSCSSVIDKFKL